ncbi:MAG: cyclic nucleotide-binding domain-containing protein [Anaerolineae bacterium]|nr:cyclic nucleotide-binding domain-containing protein [Anaerolineae bacterium]
MTNNDDSLDELIQAVGKSKKKPGRAPGPEPPEKKALNPLELLNLPDTQRKIVNYLSHQKRAGIEEISQEFQTLAVGELEQAMRALREAGYVREALIDGEVYYRVVFGGTTRRSKIVLPADIWSRLKMDNITFLQQMPMFGELSRSELRRIADQMETRDYERNEVIVWQGQPSDNAFLVKNGIVGISHLSPDRKSSQMLAYLKQGDILGEIGVLQNQVRSATATAFSNVEMLVIKHDHFLELLEQYDRAAIELARMLGRQLVATSARLGHEETETHIVLVFRIAKGSGGTTVASTLAATLARETQRGTVYTEYPNPRQLPARFGFAANADLYRHPAGYDIRLPQVDPALPDDVDATLMIDQLVGQYGNIVIGLPDNLDAGTVYLLGRADQVVLVTPPAEAAWEKLKELRTSLREYIRSDKIGMLTVINRARQEDQNIPAPGQADFDLPYLADLPTQPVDASPPPSLVEITRTIIDRLGRTSEIAVYIPTTLDIDQSFDTTPYVKEVLAFMGERFGGATSSQAEGVWDSDETGLVNEIVHIVRSFVTQKDLNERLDAVLKYVVKMKEELRQEAMAVEVDRKLMLV